MPTVKDVAREAGVSLGTVSNVLNNRSSVKEKNRQAVLQAIEKLNFVSNMTARALKTKTSRTIGLLIPSITNPFYPEIARGVEDAAFQSGLTVFLCNYDRDVKKQRTYVNELIQKNVDGLIIARSQLTDEEINEISQKVGTVLLGVERQTPHLACNMVVMQMENGMREAMEFLERNGHERIAYVAGTMEPEREIRSVIYQKCLTLRGIHIRPEYIVGGKYDWQSGYEAGKKLAALPDPPTAIITSNDMMAIGTLNAVQECGLKVPGDISIIGNDNIEMSKMVTPALTTIDMPKYEMGRMSVEMIKKILDGNEKSGHRMYVDTTLVLRDSAGPVPPSLPVSGRL